MFSGFKKGFLLDKKKDKGKSPESSKKPGQLSTGDQQLALMGVSPKEYHERQSDQHGSSEADKRKLPDTGEGQRKNLSNEFRQLGGNTSLAEARIICLGDTHTNPRHTELNAQLINIAAKDGDIILIEGAPAYQEYRQEARDQTKLISKKVRVFGWDDYELTQTTMGIVKKRVEIRAILNSGTCNEEEYAKRWNEHEQLDIQRKAIGIVKRNEVLAQVISTMKESFPTSKIFVLAGEDHFTDDTSFEGYLSTNQYITFKPTSEMSVGDREKQMQQYYGEH